MLGVTAFITTNVTPVPLLWVIPLSLYLFSFVVVFSRNENTSTLVHRVMVVAMPITLAVLTIAMLTEMRNPYWALILLHLFGFFVVAMVLHGELARDRPPARNLTEFYLWVAVGGVLGGIFNALIAPVAFHSVVEYPLVIVLGALFLPGAVLAQLTRRQDEEQAREEELGDPQQRTTAQRLLNTRFLLDLALPLALGVVIVAIGWVVDNVIASDYRSLIWEVTIGLGAGVCLWFAYASNRPIRFGLGIAALIIAVSFANGSAWLFQDRSFFGVYMVRGEEISEENPTPYHTLIVGDTNHGAQVLGIDPPVPTAYHERTGPFGQLFELLPEQTTDEEPIAVMGLGAGVMACYAQPGQEWTFYEIDPLVEQIARNPTLFTYLRDCPGEYPVVLGDARLKLAEAPDGKYGMIIGEAFSSDAIPVHLLTREATDMYLDKMAENGVLVHHISNRHLELEPVVGDLARDRGLVCYANYDANSEETPGKLLSHFTVLAREEADLGSLPDDPRWSPCVTSPDADYVWTDDFSNLLSTFDWN